MGEFAYARARSQLDAARGISPARRPHRVARRSTEQHAYLSLETDNIIAERLAVEGAEPLGIPVLPVLAYGITPGFGAFPGSPSLRLETFVAAVRDILDSLHSQGFRRFAVVNGHGGNDVGRVAVLEWMITHEDSVRTSCRTTTS